MVWVTWLAMVLALLLATGLNSAVKQLANSAEFKDSDIHPLMSKSHSLTSDVRNARTVAWSVFALLAIHA
jgi:hypothetical protein